MDMLSSNTGLMGWVDYLPVYVDNSATDAWAITATGFIPYAASGGGSSPAFTSILTALTNAAGTVTTLAYINPGSGGTLTLSVTESVASGVAPVAVFFDATASTSTQTTRPIHDVFYAWDFGDTTAGTWANGTGANSSRNVAYGPVASHMFETAGTYTVTLTAHDGVSTTTTTKTITVTAADTEWAGTKTVCYSTGAAPVPGVNGVPTGATCVGGVTDISASYAANKGTGNKRHLLQAGDTFAIASRLDIDVGGPSMMGKFGSGANPIINSTLTATAVIGLSKSTTPTGVSDWRFQDLTIDCGNQNNAPAFAGNGSFSKVLLNRVYLTRCGYGLLLSGSTIDALNAAVPFTHAMWDQVYMVDSTIYDLYTSSTGPISIFGNASRAVVMGCNINNNGNGEHGIRFQYCNRAVFNNNTIQGIAPSKVNLTIRGGPYAGSNTLAAPVYSEKVVASDNLLIGGASVGMVGIGPQNGSNDERGRDMIFERNMLVGSATTQNTMLVSQIDVTIRNNMVTLPAGAGGGFAFGAQPSGLVPCPTRVNVYNNSVYHGGNAAFQWALFRVSINNDVTPVDQTLPGCTFEVKNNILYCPNKPSTYYTMTYKDAEAQSVTTASNNTADASNTTSPLFATNPPTAIAHFTPSSGSYANGAGTNVKNWRDFYNTATQATPDLGAVVI
jgi:PKD repeat protein